MMSRSAKDYLAKHNIPVLFDQISKELLGSKPDDPISLVLEILKKKKASLAAQPPQPQAAQPVRSAARRLSQSKNNGRDKDSKRRPTIGISAETLSMAPLKMQHDALAAELRANNPNLVVIDVREQENYPGGHIKGSVHVPFSEFEGKVQSLVSSHGSKSYIVFVCMNSETHSPMAATSFMSTLKTASNNVFVLLGGFAAFVRSNTNTGLVADFDSSMWSKIWDQMGTSIPGSSSSNSVSIVAPEMEPPPPLYAANPKRSPSLSRGTSFRLKEKKGLQAPSLSIPTAPVQIDKEGLADMIKARKNICVVDVRESDYVGGHIPNSKHIPLQDIQEHPEDHVSKLSGYEMVIFTCMNGESHSSTGGAVMISRLQGSKVGVLSGGFVEWVKAYSDNLILVEDFDATLWNMLWATHKAKTPKLGRLQSKKNLKLSLSTTAAPQYSSISFEKLREMIPTKSCLIVDVRGKEEHQGGHFKDSMHIPADEFQQRMQEILCESGGKTDVVFLCMNAETQSPECANHFHSFVQTSGSTVKSSVLQNGFIGVVRDLHGQPTVRDQLLVDFNDKLWTALQAAIGSSNE
eukprot:TRINITY_DN47751_c0_g1_i1.p1 TRINITY_DN47751_c0_g1~~TRINITY_DN47751_c0_g1_i1.p1  ORF type:complete len:577 (+),score=48.09 TRINITY_DN47751_c0_g1_i1:78-1808(+)